MKKKFICIIFCISGLLFLPSLAEAQTSCGSIIDAFTISCTSTPSTCQANGTITVNLGGDLSNISKAEYSLTSTTGSFSLAYQSPNVLTGVPSGSYTVMVRAFCKEDESYFVVKSALNVVVGGNYVVPQASLNLGGSRKSYQGCGTGSIVLNVTGGNQGAFTFTVTSAPSGVTVPQTVTATRGTGVNSTVYTLAGENWPAGNYTIQAYDGCFSAQATFTLGTATGFPVFVSETSSGFRADVDNSKGSCGYVGWFAGSNQVNDVSNYPDYTAHFKAGMYEIGIAPAGTSVNAVTNWTTWTTNSAVIFFNISPHKISEFYGANSIAVYIRVKGCPTVYRSFTANIRQPVSSDIYVNLYALSCNNITLSISFTNLDNVMVCYPLILTVKTTGGTVVYNNPSWYYNSRSPITLEYGVAYTVTFTDQNGTTFSTNIAARSKSPLNLYYLQKDSLFCSGYKSNFYLYSSSPDSCFSWPVKVTITDPGGSVVQQVNFTQSSIQTRTPLLEYNKIYTIRTDYPDGTFNTFTSNVPLPAAKTYLLTIGSSSQCYPNTGSLYIYTNPSSPTTAIPYSAGTTFTITGPPGYTPQTATATEADVNAVRSRGNISFSMPSTILPPGTYSLRVDNDCGNSYTATFTNPGLYDYTGFNYTSSTQSCVGMTIYPTGQITYQRQPSTTNFWLTSGPAGYDQAKISPGGSFFLSTPGKYVLAIGPPPPFGCPFATDTIYYTLPQLSLDANITSSYVCVGAGVGNISITGINGTAPYTYQLYDSANVVKQPVADITKSGIAHFSYGEGGKTYTVRVSDACGNNFAQRIKVINLNTEHIVYTTNNRICVGDSIKLNCATLGTTAYSWTGPNGYTSNIQNPVILNAQANRTGWYKVTVQPEYCGSAVKDSIYITVSNLTLISGAGETKTTCIHAAVPVLSDTTVTGGTGNYTYQWQSSPDGTSGWTNIAGATNNDYQPAISTESAGIYYYRRITTDKCSFLNGNVLTLIVRHCYVPVNPNLMNKVRK